MNFEDLKRKLGATFYVPLTSESIYGRLYEAAHVYTRRQEMNAIRVIHPYKYFGTWVFDDPAKELDKEAFVSGADDIMSAASAGLQDPENGFDLLFSEKAFPGHQFCAEHVREELDGNWYRVESLGLEGWLCPALFKYFDTAPKKIFFQVKESCS